MGRISLHGIEVWAHHGVLPQERERGQPFVVHVTIELDLTDAVASDDLADTVDYGALAGEIATAASDGPYDLIEAVAGHVLDAVLAHERVQAAEVTVDKPHAPLGVPASGVSITLRRER